MPAIPITIDSAQPSSRPLYTRRLALFGIVGGSALIGAALITSGLSSAGTTLDAWRMAVRVTARFSLVLFLLAFLASSLARIFTNNLTRSLLRERRGMGLAFAGAHFVHLGAFVTYFALGGLVPPAPVLIAGGLGYLVVAAMAATSNDWSTARLGAKNWRRLHVFGLYYIWLIFALTYLSRAAKGPFTILDGGLLALIVAAIVLRLAVPLFLGTVRREAAPVLKN